ncbi:hypothetical protein Rhal01_00132 [Rubritalea halochordaticola]|uniref:FAD:protein FMN transferase n=1 Tax=Rubritalea halochordaticola TaxID=714537 RepID=A0ABP9UUS5_9BACT
MDKVDRRHWLRGLGASWLLASCSRNSETRESQQSRAKEPDLSQHHVWSGIGFGIEMSMELYGVDTEAGEAYGQLLEEVIAGYEAAFSFYSEYSEVNRLNRERKLEESSELFRSVVKKARLLEGRTLGYFEPGIQGWLKYISDGGSEGDGEWLAFTHGARMENLKLMPGGAFEILDENFGLNLNAIVQGCLADSMADILRKDKVSSAILHLGETYALGGHPEDRPWKLGVMGREDLVGYVELQDAGLAVSRTGKDRDLLDPVHARLVRNDRVVAVISGEGAATADAFATAYAVADKEDWENLYENLAKSEAASVKLWEDGALVFER